MLASYRGVHLGQSIAVLGSGPTLGLFAAQQGLAIAVNGAATCDVPYQYFACGDAASPQQVWFYGSRRCAAKRIVASFLAPRDAMLFPSLLTRCRLRCQRLPHVVAARLRGSMAPLYDYSPRARPAGGHGWFRYSVPAFPADGATLLATLHGGRVLHGATIAGVAVQLAFWMGAGEIHLYGCSMDNDAGENYYRSGSRGQTTALQRQNFAALTRWVGEAGVPVVTHNR